MGFLSWVSKVGHKASDVAHKSVGAIYKASKTVSHNITGASDWLHSKVNSVANTYPEAQGLVDEFNKIYTPLHSVIHTADDFIQKDAPVIGNTIDRVAQAGLKTVDHLNDAAKKAAGVQRPASFKDTGRFLKEEAQATGEDLLKAAGAGFTTFKEGSRAGADIADIVGKRFVPDQISGR